MDPLRSLTFCTISSIDNVIKGIYIPNAIKHIFF